MSPLLRDNPGDRPSRLALGRLHTGELEGEERAAVEAWLRDHPEAGYLDELAAARERVRPLDVEAIRARSMRSEATAPSTPAPANSAWRWALPLLAVAAAVLLFLRIPSEPVDPEGVRFKGSGSLELFALRGELLVPYEGEALGEGDTIGFRVVPGTHDHLVLLSVEVDGSVNVFYPESGLGSEPVAPGGHPVELPDSIVLDGAPDPEIFVAVFGADVLDARDRVALAWEAGGLDGILDWADADPDADAVEVVRR